MQTPISSLSLHPRSERNDDSVAQPVEHNTFNVGVLGSSPSWITIRMTIRYNKRIIADPFLYTNVYAQREGRNEIRYSSILKDSIFNKRSLRRGISFCLIDKVISHSISKFRDKMSGSSSFNTFITSFITT